MTNDELLPALREELLLAEIAKWSAKGYHVTMHGKYRAQMVKPKKFSFFWAAFWFLMLLVPFVLYLLLYLARKDEVIWIEVSTIGRVKVTK